MCVISKKIRISEETYRSLQRFAKPFEDTVDDAIKRLITWAEYRLEAEGRSPSAEILQSDLQTPIDETQCSDEETELEPPFQHGSEKGSDGATPQTRYEELIPIILFYFQGDATPSEVESIISDVVAFTEDDMRPHDSQKYVWKNRVHWARLQLKKDGLISCDSPRGLWELTQFGLEKAQELAAAHPEVTEHIKESICSNEKC